MAANGKDLRKEFAEMGRDRVRADLMYGRFPPDKRNEARIWLETVDAESWQKNQGSGTKSSLMRNETIKKLLPYIGGAAFLIIALSQMARH